jgi:hypothetical protein
VTSSTGASQTFFEKLGEGEKAIERLGAGGELHNRVDVAIGAGLATQDGTEQGEPLNPEGTDLGSDATRHSIACSG